MAGAYDPDHERDVRALTEACLSRIKRVPDASIRNNQNNTGTGLGLSLGSTENQDLNNSDSDGTVFSSFISGVQSTLFWQDSESKTTSSLLPAAPTILDPPGSSNSDHSQSLAGSILSGYFFSIINGDSDDDPLASLSVTQAVKAPDKRTLIYQNLALSSLRKDFEKTLDANYQLNEVLKSELEDRLEALIEIDARVVEIDGLVGSPRVRANRIQQNGVFGPESSTTGNKHELDNDNASTEKDQVPDNSDTIDPSKPGGDHSTVQRNKVQRQQHRNKILKKLYRKIYDDLRKEFDIVQTSLLQQKYNIHITAASGESTIDKATFVSHMVVVLEGTVLYQDICAYCSRTLIKSLLHQLADDVVGMQESKGGAVSLPALLNSLAADELNGKLTGNQVQTGSGGGSGTANNNITDSDKRRSLLGIFGATSSSGAGLSSVTATVPIKGVPGLAERFAAVEPINTELIVRLQAERKFVSRSEVEAALDENYRLMLDLQGFFQQDQDENNNEIQESVSMSENSVPHPFAASIRRLREFGEIRGKLENLTEEILECKYEITLAKAAGNYMFEEKVDTAAENSEKNSDEVDIGTDVKNDADKAQQILDESSILHSRMRKFFLKHPVNQSGQLNSNTVYRLQNFDREMRPRKPQISSQDDHYHTFKLLTYNIFMRPPTPNFIHNNGVDDFKDERLIRFLKLLGQYDIILLQEMFASGAAHGEEMEVNSQQFSTVHGEEMEVTTSNSQQNFSTNDNVNQVRQHADTQTITASNTSTSSSAVTVPNNNYTNSNSILSQSRAPGALGDFTSNASDIASVAAPVLKSSVNLAVNLVPGATGASYRKEMLIGAAKQAGFYNTVSSPGDQLLWSTRKGFNPNGQFVVDGGLVVLSKFPIVKRATMTFRNSGSTTVSATDRLAAKGAVYAKIQVKLTQYVHVITTHLQAQYEENDGSQNVRYNQILELIQFIRECCAEDEVSVDDDIYGINGLNTAKNQVVANSISNPLASDSDQMQRASDLNQKSSIGAPKQRHYWPIILAGDFNVNARASSLDGANHSEEYIRMKELFESHVGQVFDLAYDSLKGEHPITYADTWRSIGTLNGNLDSHIEYSTEDDESGQAVVDVTLDENSNNLNDSDETQREPSVLVNKSAEIKSVGQESNINNATTDKKISTSKKSQSGNAKPNYSSKKVKQCHAKIHYTPVDRNLTCPSDFEKDCFRRQSLDYIFYFPGPQQTSKSQLWQSESSTTTTRPSSFQASVADTITTGTDSLHPFLTPLPPEIMLPSLLQSLQDSASETAKSYAVSAASVGSAYAVQATYTGKDYVSAKLSETGVFNNIPSSDQLSGFQSFIERFQLPTPTSNAERAFLERLEEIYCGVKTHSKTIMASSQDAVSNLAANFKASDYVPESFSSAAGNGIDVAQSFVHSGGTLYIPSNGGTNTNSHNEKSSTRSTQSLRKSQHQIGNDGTSKSSITQKQNLSNKSTIALVADDESIQQIDTKLSRSKPKAISSDEDDDEDSLTVNSNLVEFDSSLQGRSKTRSITVNQQAQGLGSIIQISSNLIANQNLSTMQIDNSVGDDEIVIAGLEGSDESPVDEAITVDKDVSYDESEVQNYGTQIQTADDNDSNSHQQDVDNVNADEYVKKATPEKDGPTQATPAKGPDPVEQIQSCKEQLQPEIDNESAINQNTVTANSLEANNNMSYNFTIDPNSVLNDAENVENDNLNSISESNSMNIPQAENQIDIPSRSDTVGGNSSYSDTPLVLFGAQVAKNANLKLSKEGPGQSQSQWSQQSKDSIQNSGGSQISTIQSEVQVWLGDKEHAPEGIANNHIKEAPEKAASKPDSNIKELSSESKNQDIVTVVGAAADSDETKNTKFISNDRPVAQRRIKDTNLQKLFSEELCRKTDFITVTSDDIDSRNRIRNRNSNSKSVSSESDSVNSIAEVGKIIGHRITVTPETCDVEKFEVDRRRDIGAPVTHLSDHYGLKVILQV